MSRVRVVALVGTNASGKSDLAVRVGAGIDAEIVSADSRQVYRGVRLASGVVPEAERALVPHHCIEFAEPGRIVSLKEYLDRAHRAVEDIAARGRVPFVVGGSPLYTSALIDGYVLPGVPPDAEFRRWAEGIDEHVLFDRLRELDPSWAQSLDASNRRRVVRAIELARAGVGYAAAHRRAPRYRVLELGITWPDEVLRARIRTRLRARLDAGMVPEISAMLDRGVPPRFFEELGLEFRHVLSYLDGRHGSEQELFEALSTAIWRFSRRQLRWYRRRPSVVWLEPERACAQLRSLSGDFLGV